MKPAALRRLRPWVQLGAFLLFTYLLLRAGRPGIVPADLFFRLDPLAGLAGSLAARQLAIGMAVGAASALVAALVLGRVWCGWICPLGTVLDWTPSRRPRGATGETDPAPWWRRTKYVLLIVILVAALLDNLTLLFLDPISILYRTMAAALWPALNALISGAEGALYAVPPLRGLVDAAEGALRGTALPTYQPLYRLSIPITLLFLTVLALNAARPRFWCRYLCPLGGLLGIVSRAAWLQRNVSGDCVSCQRCARACPVGTIDAKRGYASDPAECTLCLDCVSACAKDGQDFRFRWHPGISQTYDPSRRHFLASAALGTVLVGLLNTEAAAGRDHSYLVRPPGAQGRDFLARCIRCGICLKTCPTSGLQPSLVEAGWGGALTPILVPRLGYCEYSCNACGQACPVGAIPPLSLPDKQQTVIGLAYIDQNRCIPWADNRNCIVCEEMCPIAEKAIVLDDVEIQAPDGSQMQVRRPRVIRERCIGCGICESKCPLRGEAAIRVYVPTDLSTATG